MSCNKKWKSAHDKTGRYLGYLHAEADPDRSYPVSRGMEKYEALHFGGIQRLACRAISASAELLANQDRATFSLIDRVFCEANRTQK